MNTIQSHQLEINKLCLQHQVSKLYVFGSVLTTNFNEESDIDLIVDFKSIEILEYADNYFDFKFKLQDLLKHPIDLLEEKALKNPYFINAINQQKQLIYG